MWRCRPILAGRPWPFLEEPRFHAGDTGLNPIITDGCPDTADNYSFSH